MKVSADLYDTLEFVAEAYDGVGANRYSTGGEDGTTQDKTSDPECGMGLLLFAKDMTASFEYEDKEIVELQDVIGDGGMKSDAIVSEYRRQAGQDPWYSKLRMPFNLWAPAVGLERGN